MREDTFRCQVGNNQTIAQKCYHVSTAAYILDIPYDMNTGCFKPWRLYSETEEYRGDTVEELRFLIPDLINHLSLKKETKANRKTPDIDVILIFIDNLFKVEDIFDGMITDHIQHGDKLKQITVMNHFIFQNTWGDSKLDEKYNSLEIMQGVMNKWFIPKNHIFTGVPEIDRRDLEKTSNRGKLAHTCEYYPKGWSDWFYLRCAMQSPIRFRSGSSDTHEKMLYMDITSAYIYALLTFKHCASSIKKVSPFDWRSYRNRTDKGSWGTYTITYSSYEEYIRCFKADNGEEFSPGPQQTVVATLTNVDLDVLTSLRGVTVEYIQCHVLYEFDMDYPPDYYRECIKDGYLDKVHCEKSTVEYDLAKMKLNSGVFGNTIIKTPLLVREKALSEGKSVREANKLAEQKLYRMSIQGTLPQWGIWAISYIRKVILELGQNLTGWCLSNTDSIVCCDTEENRDYIKEYNQKTQEKIKVFCEKFGEDFEDLKNLGSFDITELKYFRCWDRSTYAYLENGYDVPVVKASGVKLKEDFTIKEIFDKDAPKPKGEMWPQGYLDKDGHYREQLVNAEYVMLYEW